MSSNHTGYWALMMHAHLPFVRHPEFEEFLEEDWLYEAITETYIPILHILEGFERDGVNACFTMSLTPPLCEMLADGMLQERYLARMYKLAELAERELERTAGSEQYQSAYMYNKQFRSCIETFENKWGRNILNGFRHYQDLGLVEITTCCATHGFLPLMVTESAVRAQLRIARVNYRKHFGRDPRGIWLAECGYGPDIDRFLREENYQYFFVDTHCVLFGAPRPRFGSFRPIYTPHGPAAFARDPDSSRQVWSSEEGYPGDFRYREFFRDLGYDGDYNYIRPYLHKDGLRRSIGMKYHKITGKVELGGKHYYQPHEAEEAVAGHAGHFLHQRQIQVRDLRDKFDGHPPLVISPYDAELFGHWWFEGPRFLDILIRRMVYDQNEVGITTPARWLEQFPHCQVVEPTAGSWGDKGYNEVWLNGGNDWIYRHLHAAEAQMNELANKFQHPNPLQDRALKQAARELLLAQSSDWAFLMTTETAIEYAEKRTKDHIHRFHGLYLQLMESRLEEPWLRELEWKDNIFQEIDYRVYG